MVLPFFETSVSVTFAEFPIIRVIRRIRGPFLIVRDERGQPRITRMTRIVVVADLGDIFLMFRSRAHGGLF